MNKDKIMVFIIDDEFPPYQEFVSRDLYKNAISSTDLYELTIKLKNWGTLDFLKDLIQQLIESNEYQSGLIDVLGFKNPSFALNSIDDNILPNIVIYDWEYGMPNPTESQNMLIEILESAPETFVIVYSKVRDEIPQFLNKSIFDKYSKRFQLIKKAESEFSVFNSEEFILQFILSKASRNPEIFIGGKKIKFTQNGFLDSPKDILYIEEILGKESLISKLKSVDTLDNESIQTLFSNEKQDFYFDELNQYLIVEDADIFLKKYNPKLKYSMIETIIKFGVLKTSRAIERGITKI